ncbi:MAG: M23 family metallopeptidase [Candidatus Abyssubacteria bacterium]
MQTQWNILLIPSSGRAHDIKLSSRNIKIMAASLSLLAISFCATIFVSVHMWKEAAIQRLSTLECELRGREQMLASLRTDFGRLIELEGKLRTIAGLKPRWTTSVIPEDGGKGGPELEFIDYTEPVDDLSAIVAVDIEGMSAGALLDALVETRGSFSEILETFVREEKRLLSVPSINPVASPDAWISSGYGYRKDPIHGRRRFHEGIDIVAPRRTPVIAPADGVVSYSGWRDGLGRTVEIVHGFGYKTIFGHNEKLLVKKGAHVKRGDPIALLGNSGRSTGPHLHYEIRLNAKLVNPYQYVMD